MSDDDIIICILLGLCVAAGSPAQLVEAVKLVHQRHPTLRPDQCRLRAARLVARLKGLAELLDND